MKALKSYICESFNSYLVMYIAKFVEARRFNSLREAQSFVKTVDGLKYYDITTGNNSSEESNLVEWGGTGGYWDNFCNNPVFLQTPREKKAAERAAKKYRELA